jgi:hypothetical protein
MPDRPSILLITTDQQRFDTIHTAGSHHICYMASIRA